MNVALDIDDTITRHPEFFAFLSKVLRDGGHKVFIITFRHDEPDTRKDLKSMGITFDKLVVASGEELERVGFCEWKGNVCKELDVDIMFEDMVGVAKRIPDSVLTFIPFNKSVHAIMDDEDEW